MIFPNGLSITILTILIIVIGLIPQSVSSQPGRADCSIIASARSSALDYFLRGLGMVGVEDFDTAFEFFACAGKLHPENAAYHYAMGRLMDAQNQYDEAIFYYSIAIDVAPEVGYFYNARSLAYHGMGNWDASFEDAKSWIVLRDAGKIEGEYELREAFFYPPPTRFQRSYDDLTHFLELHDAEKDHDYVEALIARNRVINQIETVYQYLETDKAIADLNQALEIEPDNIMIYLERSDRYYGVRLSESQRSELILADLKAAEQIDPTNVTIYWKLADLYDSQQEWEQARLALERAIEVAPDRAGLYWRYGESCHRDKACDEAVAVTYMQKYIDLTGRQAKISRVIEFESVLRDLESQP